MPDAKDISISNQFCDKHKQIRKLTFEFVQRKGKITKINTKKKVPHMIPLKLTTCIFCPSILSEYQMMNLFKLPTKLVKIHSNPKNTSNNSNRLLGKRNEYESKRNNDIDQKKKKDEIPNCKHDKKSILLTCRSGINSGREFYKCSILIKDQQCDFFQWKE